MFLSFVSGTLEIASQAKITREYLLLGLFVTNSAIAFFANKSLV
jgi:hypothetical protein